MWALLRGQIPAAGLCTLGNASSLRKPRGGVWSWLSLIPLGISGHSSAPHLSVLPTLQPPPAHCGSTHPGALPRKTPVRCISSLWTDQALGLTSRRPPKGPSQGESLHLEGGPGRDPPAAQATAEEPSARTLDGESEVQRRQGPQKSQRLGPSPTLL